MKAILRAGTYELIARPDVPLGSVISEYLDVADAFYDKREKGFVNGLLDAIAKDVAAGTRPVKRERERLHRTAASDRDRSRRARAGR